MNIKGFGLVLGSISSSGVSAKNGGNLKIIPGKKFSKPETANGLDMMIRKDGRGDWALQSRQKSIKKIVLTVGMTAKGVNPVLAYINPPKLTSIQTY